MHKPIFEYLKGPGLIGTQEISGAGRIVEADGRKGFLPRSIHTSVALPKHTVNEPCGSVSLWFYSLEDLDSMTHHDTFKISNPDFATYTFLSDSPPPSDFVNSHFSFSWSNHWYPQLFAKFYQGRLQPDGYFPTLKAVVGAGHFRIHKHKWYHLCLTWNRAASRIKIFVNGVLVAHSDTVHNNLEFQNAGPTLYVGNPTMAVSDIACYDTELTNQDVLHLFEETVALPYPSIQEDLLHMYCGKDMETFSFALDDTWRKQCDLPLTDAKDLDYFYVQGKPDAASITPDGMLIETTQNLLTTKGAGTPDRDACYLWTNQFFEGNLYLEYEFKSLQRDGLSLLMVQASGMQREDFMADYPLRTNGAMAMVCWEDVRNYHWEYYRYVPDVRNDVASHAMIKNPWLKPMGYSCEEQPMSIGEWHKLQFLQIEDHLQCVIDGKIVLDMYDDPFQNHGPVLNCGRIAIRCMIRTKLLVRNFRVYNQSQISGLDL